MSGPNKAGTAPEGASKLEESDSGEKQEAGAADTLWDWNDNDNDNDNYNDNDYSNDYNDYNNSNKHTYKDTSIIDRDEQQEQNIIAGETAKQTNQLTPSIGSWKQQLGSQGGDRGDQHSTKGSIDIARLAAGNVDGDGNVDGNVNVGGDGNVDGNVDDDGDGNVDGDGNGNMNMAGTSDGGLRHVHESEREREKKRERERNGRRAGKNKIDLRYDIELETTSPLSRSSFDEENQGSPFSDGEMAAGRRSPGLGSEGGAYDSVSAPMSSTPHGWTLHQILVTGSYVLLWYVFSVSISVYNKWMFAPEHLNFPFPVFATCCHQIVMTGLAALVLGLVPAARPASPFTSAKDYLRRVLPCAVASCGDIGMGNASFRLVTLSFYTMVKSANLLFVLLFSILFRLERPSWRIFIIISIMTLGVLLMAAGETQFQVLGFFLVLGASMSSGLRWSLTQILLKRAPQTHQAYEPLDSPRHTSSPQPSASFEAYNDNASENGPAGVGAPAPAPALVTNSPNTPVYTILCLAPLMAIMLFVLACIIEGPSKIFGAKLWREGFFRQLVYLMVPGILAFCMTLAEFLLLNRTSVLTLAIIGICKEIVTFGIAFIFFGDVLTPLNALGVVVTTICILAYNYDRYTKSKAKARAQAKVAGFEELEGERH